MARKMRSMVLIFLTVLVDLVALATPSNSQILGLKSCSTATQASRN